MDTLTIHLDLGASLGSPGASRRGHGALDEEAGRAARERRHAVAPLQQPLGREPPARASPASPRPEIPRKPPGAGLLPRRRGVHRRPEQRQQAEPALPPEARQGLRREALLLQRRADPRRRGHRRRAALAARRGHQEPAHAPLPQPVQRLQGRLRRGREPGDGRLRAGHRAEPARAPRLRGLLVGRRARLRHGGARGRRPARALGPRAREPRDGRRREHARRRRRRVRGRVWRAPALGAAELHAEGPRERRQGPGPARRRRRARPLHGPRARRRGRVPRGAAEGRDVPNFKGSSLGRFSLVSASFWTSDHLSEHSRSTDGFSGAPSAAHSRRSGVASPVRGPGAAARSRRATSASTTSRPPTASSRSSRPTRAA